MARQANSLNFRDEQQTWNTWDALPKRCSSSSRECTNYYSVIGICSADPRDMNVVDLYWGGSTFSCGCSFFSLGWQVVLRRETKQVELSSSLSIRNSSGRLAEKIKSIQLFGHLTQKNLVCSFPLLFVLISFSCFMYNVKHKSAQVLSWNSKPPCSQTQKYLPKGQMSPLKTNFNIVPGGNKCDFFPFV